MQVEDISDGNEFDSVHTKVSFDIANFIDIEFLIVVIPFDRPHSTRIMIDIMNRSGMKRSSVAITEEPFIAGQHVFLFNGSTVVYKPLVERYGITRPRK